MRRLIRYVLAALLCAGCASERAVRSETGSPAWFETPDRLYDRQLYLTAVGTGATPQDAQDRAFGNLSRTFQAEIDVSQTLAESFVESDIGGEVNVERTTQLLETTDIRSKQELLNVRVLEQQTGGDGTHYALVGLPRQETAAVYATEIERNRAMTQTYRASADEATHPLDRLTLLKKALTLARVNAALTTQRNVILGGRASDEDTTIVALQEAFRTARAACPVLLHAGPVPDPVVASVRAAFVDEGFAVTQAEREAVVRAAVEYAEEPTLQSRADAHFIQWSLHVRLTDAVRGHEFESFSAMARSGAPTGDGAVQRARRAASEAAAYDFRAFLQHELFSTD